VVGYSKTADGEVHAFRYFREAIFDLSTLGGKESYAYLITNSGILIGDSRTPDGMLRPFMGAPNSPLLNLGGDPHLFSSARGANNVGQVVGFRLIIDEHGQFHKRAYLYTTNRTIDLGTFGGLPTYAVGINNAGQVVGYSTNNSAFAYAFLWTAGTGMVDLGHLSEPGCGQSSRAHAINDAGQVVGESCDHAFRWTAAGVRHGIRTHR